MSNRQASEPLSFFNFEMTPEREAKLRRALSLSSAHANDPNRPWTVGTIFDAYLAWTLEDERKRAKTK